MAPPGLRFARLAPACALVVLAVIPVGPALAGGALFLRDINMVWLPQVESFVRVVTSGAWPVWDPFAGFGRPLLADPRAEIFYPPTWLNLVLPPARFYALFAFGHVLLAGTGAWRLGRAWGLSRPAAMAGAGLWMSSGPLLSLVAMWHHLAGAAWLPWVVLAFERVAEEGTFRRAAAAGATAAVQLFAGSPDLSALTAAVVALDLAFGRAGGWDARRARALAAAGALAVALSAVQWAPTLAVVGRSSRSAQEARVAETWSLHPLVLPEAVVPMRWADASLTRAAAEQILESREPWLRSIYLGAASLCLVGAGLMGGAPRRRALLVVGALALLVALGRHSPAEPLLARLPGARAFRFPVKAMVPFAFAWAMLAAGGLDAWRAGVPAARRAARATAAVLLATLATVVLGRAHLPASVAERLAAPLPPSLFTAVAVALALALVAAVVVALPRPPRAAAWLLALLAVADPSARHRTLNPAADAALFSHRPQTLALLDTSGLARTYVYDYSMDPGRRRPPPAPLRAPYRVARLPAGWPLAAGTVLGIHEYLHPPTAARWGVFGSFDLDILGFDPLPLVELDRRLRDLEDAPGHARLLRLGAVRNVLALVPAPWWADLEPAAEAEGFFEVPIRVLRVRDPVPRAYVVDGVRVADGPAALDALTDPAFEPRRELVLARGVARAPAAAGAGTASVTAFRADRVAVALSAPAPGHLVLVDAWDPGWTATLDGTPVEVLRANVAFRAVAVPAGAHEVVFRYRPPGLFAGALVTLLAAMAAAVLLLRSGSGGSATREAVSSSGGRTGPAGRWRPCAPPSPPSAPRSSG